MIISASRRTDIPAFYSEWFLNRLKAEYVFVRNPMNMRQISTIRLKRDVVDGIVFWTKNPTPMLEKLNALSAYPYYFQFTLTPYGRDIEPGLPSKKSSLIPIFQNLSKKIGRKRVIWRYDPIFINAKHTEQYHLKSFKTFCAALSGYTEKCAVSFIDMYQTTERNMRDFGLISISMEQKLDLLEKLSAIAKNHDILLQVCGEEIDNNALGIPDARCIDADLFGEITGVPLKLEKDKYQRTQCGCVESIDIGTYNTCKNGCRYCYANSNPDRSRLHASKHDPTGELLFGTRIEKDRIYQRPLTSSKYTQGNLFDLPDS